jgi:hypothetical protein
MYTRRAYETRGRALAQPMGRDNGSHRLPYNLVREAMYSPRISRTARYNGLKLIP